MKLLLLYNNIVIFYGLRIERFIYFRQIFQVNSTIALTLLGLRSHKYHVVLTSMQDDAF